MTSSLLQLIRRESVAYTPAKRRAKLALVGEKIRSKAQAEEPTKAKIRGLKGRTKGEARNWKAQQPGRQSGIAAGRGVAPESKAAQYQAAHGEEAKGSRLRNRDGRQRLGDGVGGGAFEGDLVEDVQFTANGYRSAGQAIDLAGPLTAAQGRLGDGKCPAYLGLRRRRFFNFLLATRFQHPPCLELKKVAVGCSAWNFSGSYPETEEHKSRAWAAPGPCRCCRQFASPRTEPSQNLGGIVHTRRYRAS